MRDRILFLISVFFSSRRRHTRLVSDWSSDVCSSDLCREKFAQAIDTAVFPGLQGGPHDHIQAAKATAFREALDPSFEKYAAQVMKNAAALAAELMKQGFRIISDGTDNHLMVVDMTSRGVPGLNAERALDAAGISCSRSTIPFDPRKPFNPSGVRLGTPAITTRGMGNDHMKIIAGWIDRVVTAAAADKASESLKGPEMTAAYKSNSAIKKVKEEVKEFCLKFPLFHS